MLAIGDGQGGAWVELRGCRTQLHVRSVDDFVVFLLPFNLPGADIYPDVRPGRPGSSRRRTARRRPAADDLVLAGQTAQRPVIQVSRRTRGGAFTAQTAVQKVEKVLEWLRNR